MMYSNAFCNQNQIIKNACKKKSSKSRICSKVYCNAESFQNKSYKTIVNIKKCSKKVFDNRSSIYDSVITKSIISLISDLSVELFLQSSHSDYQISYFIEDHVLTYVLTNMVFFALDSCKIYAKCEDDNCEV